MPADMPGLAAGVGALDPATGTVVVEVPATSANLGPGFDSLGLALGMSDRIEARFVDGTDVTVEVVGEGAGRVATDATNLVAKVVRTGLSTFDDTGLLAGRGLLIRCINAVPQSRGLGSSAAAIVGGLAVAAQLAGVAGSVTPADMVALATRLEGHPDNVAAGVLGGATISWMQAAAVGPVGRATRFPVDGRVVPVLVVPQAEASTHRARGALPASVPHADAAFNAAAPRCSSTPSRPSPPCCSTPPTTGCTSSSAGRSTRRAWAWSRRCARSGSPRPSPERVQP